MKNRESRRIVPASMIAIAVFTLLAVLEVSVICGVMQVNAAAIAKVAPWAYEPFLKLVGEHPDSYRQRGSTESSGEQAEEAASLDLLAGLGAEELLAETNAVQESTVTPVVEEEPAADPETAEPEAPPKKVVPVG